MVGNQLAITIPTTTFRNHECFKLVLCQSIPTDAAVSQVVIVNGTGAGINFLVRTGNYVRADQLRCRKAYCVVYGTNPQHFSLMECVKRSCYDVAFPTGTATAEEGEDEAQPAAQAVKASSK